MWFIGPILKIAEYVAGGIFKKMEHNQKMAAAKQDAELQVWMTKENAGVLWAQTMAEASKSSWKDEWILVLFSLPMICSMLGYPGPMDQIVRVMGQDMYRNVWIVMVSGSFGVRMWESYQTTKAANGGLAGVIAQLPKSGNSTAPTGATKPPTDEEAGWKPNLGMRP